VDGQQDPGQGGLPTPLVDPPTGLPAEPWAGLPAEPPVEPVAGTLGVPWVEPASPPPAPPPPPAPAPVAPVPWPPPLPAYNGPGKSRLTAAALALILGGIGIHKFYLDRTTAGILYLLFCWTGIPALLAWFEGIAYLLKSDAAWAAEYGGPVRRPNAAGIGCLWLVALLPFLSLGALILLIFLGGQVSNVLVSTGQGLATAPPVRSSPAATAAAAAPGTTPAPGATPAPTVTITAPAAGESEQPWPSWMTELPHQAPEVEAIVPAKVNGLPLTIWSVRGDAWLEVAGLPAANIADLRQQVEKAGGSLDDCVHVIAGRTSVEDDPPYFIYVYRIPDSAWDAVSNVVIRSAGWIADFVPDDFETATLGGKEVFVGTDDMLEQSEHQRGRPYWYELDAETLVIVVTDEEAWASDALRQLP